MERKGVMIPLLLALVAAFLYWAALSSREKALLRSTELANVLVAKTDLPERTLLKEDLVTTLSIPRKFVAQDAFEVKAPADIKLILNLVTRVRVPKGNQLVGSALTALSPTAGLSVKIPPGYRGSVIPVEKDLLDLIKPGDRIDVLVTFDAVMADNRKEKVTATILQNVLVLGVGTNLGQGVGAKEFTDKQQKDIQAQAFNDRGVLSVALNPSEVQYLALAMEQGKITPILRGLGDVEMHPIEMANFRRLFR